jgi:hypothetical protein
VGQSTGARPTGQSGLPARCIAAGNIRTTLVRDALSTRAGSCGARSGVIAVLSRRERRNRQIDHVGLDLWNVGIEGLPMIQLMLVGAFELFRTQAGQNGRQRLRFDVR